MGKDLKWEWQFIAKKVDRKTEEALRICAADLQRKSAEQAPVDTGDLRANCNVSKLTKRKGKASIRVGYNLPYAIVQHESLHFNHPKGGKAKFLEDPYKENVETYKKIIEKGIGEALK
ncbi:Bacteriophage HK97-gp10, putative tail-component [Carboxydocella thermautotrophica]|nr:Bacteriophage HK97-gp10, putative tail-component [Carboxydocella thermautotrophica]